MQILFQLKKLLFILSLVFLFSCKQQKKEKFPDITPIKQGEIEYAKGFSIERSTNGITIIKITSPWPNAESAFTYALISRQKLASISLNKDEYDAIITVPVEKVVATSTTHIPALEALGVEDKLIGFPDTKYISSQKTRKRIDSGLIKELGNNESINTEMVLEMNPDVVVGFSINNQNKTYETIQRSNIPVVYNGDWTEETPLGKAEWIKFFAPFFEKEVMADSIFSQIKDSYLEAKILAKTAKQPPTVLSGAMYKDVWYLPAGKSWAAQFLADANANYLWKNTSGTGSLSLSWETVLEKSKTADFWIGPSQFTTYKSMSEASPHYQQFDAFQNKKVFTFSSTKGDTGGLLYYELAPQRPDLVLKDLIHIFHPELLPEYQNLLFKPLE
ncbi:ABC transporter substrate-binding protein [Maribacter algarum]|uniref:ABC transporter substrate-binding protein n=1 Tax=Maribacter algarum (ex Zhang et al. 2020) TaxID=2578118 RepID=A0A5S3PJM5_9FLAO|nr:ABC transporter substrate-binding protein [Maribacter algarum]TMM53681.1 ABC transporter substrate-binding protein [Maribacter algarum]